MRTGELGDSSSLSCMFDMCCVIHFCKYVLFLFCLLQPTPFVFPQKTKAVKTHLSFGSETVTFNVSVFYRNIHFLLVTRLHFKINLIITMIDWTSCIIETPVKWRMILVCLSKQFTVFGKDVFYSFSLKPNSVLQSLIETESFSQRRRRINYLNNYEINMRSWQIPSSLMVSNLFWE